MIIISRTFSRSNGKPVAAGYVSAAIAVDLRSIPTADLRLIRSPARWALKQLRAITEAAALYCTRTAEPFSSRRLRRASCGCDQSVRRVRGPLGDPLEHRAAPQFRSGLSCLVLRSVELSEYLHRSARRGTSGAVSKPALNFTSTYRNRVVPGSGHRSRAALRIE